MSQWFLVKIPAKHKMTALPTSLRRTLLALLGFTVTIFIMVFYWNQNPPRPAALMNSIFTKVDVPTPLEKAWSYKCVGDRCVREHHLAGTKRIPFMSCAMICGTSNIWPMPTGKVSLSSRSLTFKSNQLQFDIKTAFSEAEQMLNSAYDVFLFDLKSLEEQHTRTSSQSNDVEKNKNKNKNNQQINGEKSADDNGQKADSAKMKVDENANQSCDINKFIINAEIQTMGDVFLHMDVDESYELNVTNTNGNIIHIQLKAKSFFGARHGLSTLQQLIWFDDEDNLLRIMSTAHVIDEPKFKYRGFMLDTSRNYFSVETIKRTIVGMAHAKLNRFHWHITDSQSFPYMSKAYPQLAKYGAYSSKEIYTADDIKHITDFARIRGIQIIPEIDAPAHVGNGWDWGPKYGMGELAMCINQQPWSFYCGEPPCGQLNPKNNHTYTILEKLYNELIESTGSTDVFHLGGDEVNLECWSQYFNDTDLRSLWCDFMLQAYQKLKKANKNTAPKFVLVWSSGLTNSQCLSRHNFAVQVWGGSTWQENYDLIMNGFNVIISHVDAWYLDCGFGSWRSTGEGACSPYTTWQRVYKHRPWNRMHLDPIKMKQVLGGEACLWTEQVDESNVDARIWPRTAALAERLWSDPSDSTDLDLVPKETFSRLSIFRSRLVEYGLEAEPLFPKYCAQNQDECL
ncbi:probable beta-hexosaminidase fdl isoform X1 [Sitodiplosis mosellana]|uniref:probable beta-hexosaminidase fdl isoform X1 n=2 Tax=Sitodiplosis mosellana TaxID=263140 RepID=UPI0024437C97|nr:probable beta-hexosaminidase fdl isoform X1 [Sitodiplosis mosellana]